MFFEKNFIDSLLNEDICILLEELISISIISDSYAAASCPFHDEKGQSLLIDRKNNTWYCYGCGRGGNIISFLMEFYHTEFIGAVYKASELAGIPVKLMEEEIQKNEDLKSSLVSALEKAVFYFSVLLETDRGDAKEYVKRRGLSEETIWEQKIGYADMSGDGLTGYLLREGYSRETLIKSGLSHEDRNGRLLDRFHDRIMFPIHDSNGRIAGFGGRAVHDRINESPVPKYINSPETALFHKKDLLFGFSDIKKQDDCLILCEGYMDVVSLKQAGFEGAVASLGTGLTESQCELLKSTGKMVYVCYDTDQAGRMAAVRAGDMLMKKGVEFRILDLEEYKDPDELIRDRGPGYFRERIDSAVPYEILYAGVTDKTDPEASKNMAKALIKCGKFRSIGSRIENAASVLDREKKELCIEVKKTIMDSYIMREKIS